MKTFRGVIVFTAWNFRVCIDLIEFLAEKKYQRFSRQLIMLRLDNLYKNFPKWFPRRRLRVPTLIDFPLRHTHTGQKGNPFAIYWSHLSWPCAKAAPVCKIYEGPIDSLTLGKPRRKPSASLPVDTWTDEYRTELLMNVGSSWAQRKSRDRVRFSLGGITFYFLGPLSLVSFALLTFTEGICSKLW